jgi:hypothetical protein
MREAIVAKKVNFNVRRASCEGLRLPPFAQENHRRTTADVNAVTPSIAKQTGFCRDLTRRASELLY